MIYSKLFLDRQPKIPIPIFLIVLVLMLFILVRFFGGSPVPSRASKYTLERHSISNIAYNRASVVWETEQPLVSWIVYGESSASLDRKVYDMRDVPGKVSPYIYHLADIGDLKANTTYYYVIFLKTASSIEVLNNNSGSPFSFKTSVNPPATSTASPAYGKVINPNGTPVVDSLVILTYLNAYPLTSVTKASGEWLIPLNNVVDKATQKQLLLNRKAVITVEILGSDGRSTIRSTAENTTPLPQTVILGKNYDFVNEEDVLSAVHSGGTQTGNLFAVISPREGSIIPGQSPLVRGTAYPNRDVLIQLENGSLSIKVKTDKNGSWKTALEKTLSIGPNTILVKTSDNEGKELVIRRTFTIAKSGEQVLGEATDEPTLSPTLTPTLIASTSATPTTSNVYDATPTSTSSSNIPVSGSNILPYILGAGALIIAGVGVILAF